ncbi:MAG: hypothetical protein WCC69_00550 [Pirellulales bacterium]
METVAFVRMPQPAAFLEAARKQTRFGAVALSPERMQKAWELIAPRLWPADDAQADAEAGATRLDELLGRYGLTLADVSAAFAGDAGAGLVVKTRGDGLPPLALLLAWIEPGAESAGRLLAGIKQAAEEQAADGDEPGVRRIDVTMAGHDVVWLAQPVMRREVSISVDGEPTPEKLREARKQAEAKARTTKPVQTGLTHAFCTVIGDRLLMCQTVPTANPAGVKVGVGANGQMQVEMATTVPQGPRDFEKESGGDEARGIFEQFLAAHTTADESPLTALMQTPGLQESLPDGLTLLDAMLDLGSLTKRLGAGVAGAAKGLAAAGIDGLGPLAWRHTLDGDVYRQGLFVALPAPRSGAMRILEQDADAPEVPPFVTSEAVDLTQISLDLGEAYKTIREMAVAQGGEETANMFTAAEMQAQGWLGLDLPGVLSAFGTRHWVVAYPPQVAAALAEARKARKEPGPLTAMPTVDRLAVVWQVTDEAPFQKILQRLAPLAQTEVVEEQGFRGIRLPNGPAVFVGQQHLVVAIGEDSLEKTLAAIRTPPAGETSLRESAAVARAAAMLPSAPARLFSIGDATHTGGTLGIVREILSGLEAGDVTPAYRQLLEKIRPLLPSAGDMEGMFGVSTSILETTDNGLSYRSAWELPSP